MKIIVTGAAGFIGSNISTELVNLGHDLTAVDNFHTGNSANIESIKDKITTVDKSSGEFFSNLEKEHDVICHQGIYSSSPMYKKNPHLTAKIVDEFISILEYARKKDVEKIVYASTSSIYNGYSTPHKEEMKPFIKDFYTEGRYGMERIGKLYHQLYGINVVGLRYFSIYGPHEKNKGKYANLVSQFLWKIMKGEPPVIYGDGSQSRDFVYVDDVVRANILGIEKKVSGIFNVGTGESTTINKMIEMINKRLNKNIKSEYVENPIKNYVQITKADGSKSRKELGFEAKITLEEGIKKLIEYYSE